jgi:hypothetical protein
MKFKGTFVGATLNLNAYIQQMDNHFREQLEEGAKRWVEATTGRVPLWSGMARASLLKISALANGTVVLSPLLGKSRIPEGRRLGHATLTTDFPVYRFEVTTTVPHYVIQETKNVRARTGRGSPSAPWRSFDAGREAFTEFVRSVGLPPVVFEKKVIKRL